MYKKTILLILLVIIAVFFIVNISYAMDLQVKIGKKTGVQGLGEYIETIYTFIIAAAGVMGVVVLMYAGMLWMTARGNAEQVSRAKTYMGSAVIGLIMVLGTTVFLTSINPKITDKSVGTPLAVDSPEVEQADNCAQYNCNAGNSCGLLQVDIPSCCPNLQSGQKCCCSEKSLEVGSVCDQLYTSCQLQVVPCSFGEAQDSRCCGTSRLRRCCCKLRP